MVISTLSYQRIEDLVTVSDSRKPADLSLTTVAVRPGLLADLLLLRTQRCGIHG
jgi:hypothetical protein